VLYLTRDRSPYRGEQVIGPLDQPPRLARIDRPILKGGCLEQRNHPAGERVAAGREVIEPTVEGGNGGGVAGEYRPL